MQKPRIPANEAERMAALRDLQLLDTPVEERFERITRLAAQILNVPIAAFTLIDDNRQWFKSVQGLSGLEAPRDISFCAHAINGDDVMLVSDAKADPRFTDNPMVTQAPHLGFYAGCPVRAPGGENIGTICAADTATRELTPAQVQIMRDLAALIETELSVAYLSHTRTELLGELDAAQRLALIDPLTHVWNRAGMDELLLREWSKAERNKTNFTLVIADIDHFKKINDTHGHAVGDEIIKGFTRRLLQPCAPKTRLAASAARNS